MTPEERAVLTANDAFYTAFANRDGEAMDALWARDTAVVCVHPGWAPLRDRTQVMRSWRMIFRGPRSPAVTAEDACATVVGAVAWVVCYEHIEGAVGMAGTLVATNVFVREQGLWRIAHHQAGPVAVTDDDDDDDDGDDPPDPLLN